MDNSCKVTNYRHYCNRYAGIISRIGRNLLLIQVVRHSFRNRKLICNKLIVPSIFVRLGYAVMDQLHEYRADQESGSFTWPFATFLLIVVLLTIIQGM